tara:strand:+ start:397 stop:564 length:168 start_codon:yes stop_codon:yes gene_type:complete
MPTPVGMSALRWCFSATPPDEGLPSLAASATAKKTKGEKKIISAVKGNVTACLSD